MILLRRWPRIYRVFLGDAMRAIAYLRVSSAEQAEDGTSLDVQLDACLRKAREQSASIVHIVRDEGVSGALYLARPGIQEALRWLEEGKAEAIITHRLDRQGRNVDALRQIRRRVQQAGGELIFADGITFDNTPVGNLLYTQMAGFAEFEREVIRERTLSGKRKRAEEGRQPSRTLNPYGYHIVNKRDLAAGTYPLDMEGRYVLNESQVEWVKHIFAQYLLGYPLLAICTDLEKRGVETPCGAKRWWPTTVRSILTNPVHKGQPAYQRTERHLDESRIERGLKHTYTRPSPGRAILFTSPAIVSEEDWQRAQDRLRDNKSVYSGPKRRHTLLSGFLRCCECGLPMNYKPGPKAKYGYYVCRSKLIGSKSPCRNSVNLAPGRVDPVVIRAISQIASDSQWLRAATVAYDATHTERSSSDRDRLERRLSDLERKERSTAEAQIQAIGEGRGTEVYSSILQDIHRQKQALLAELATIPAQPQAKRAKDSEEKLAAMAKGVEEALSREDVGIAEKRQLLSLLIEKIETGGGALTIHTRLNIVLSIPI